MNKVCQISHSNLRNVGYSVKLIVLFQHPNPSEKGIVWDVLIRSIIDCLEMCFMEIGEMAKLFCMQFVLHADMLFLVLYPAEHFRENGRHFPFNN